MAPSEAEGLIGSQRESASEIHCPVIARHVLCAEAISTVEQGDFIAPAERAAAPEWGASARRDTADVISSLETPDIPRPLCGSVTCSISRH